MPERDCDTCTVENKKEWGCNGRIKTDEYGKSVLDEEGNPVWEDAAFTPTDIDGERIFSCPRRPLLDDPDFFYTVLSAYQHYKNGFLPEPGSINEQPTKLMKLIGVVDGVMAEVREIEMENTRRRNK